MMRQPQQQVAMMILAMIVLAQSYCLGFLVVPTTTRNTVATGKTPSQERHPAISNDQQYDRGVTTTPSSLFLFGGVFGNEDKDDDKIHKELALYHDFPMSQLDSLTIYIQEWAQLFQQGSLGLTTPVMVKSVPGGAQILFRKVKSGYQDKNKKSGDNDGKEKKEKKNEIKQGGVEILVESMVDDTTTTPSIQVRAKRCQVEEDTMIKEMSEESIVKELDKAMKVWKKEQR